jgi:translation initiation factor 2 subunit 2
LPAKPKAEPAEHVAARSKAEAKTAVSKEELKTETAARSASKAPDYETLLRRARERIPPEVFEHPRFQIPTVDAFTEGPHTVIRNYRDIVDVLRRDPTHLLRFLSHELATAGEERGRQAVFNGRFSTPALNQLIKRYTEQFVLCPVCNRPDTEIKRVDRLLQLVCTACGARTPLKGG